jgi:hypothetical protein
MGLAMDLTCRDMSSGIRRHDDHLQATVLRQVTTESAAVDRAPVMASPDESVGTMAKISVQRPATFRRAVDHV